MRDSNNDYGRETMLLVHHSLHRIRTADLLSTRIRSASCTPHDRQQELFEEAKALTRSFYRNCLRSIRTIRLGNENDVAEFEKREREREERLNKPPDDVRLSMLSMLPAGNWEDEMRSRAEYYHQYARENLSQESDCLESDSAWNTQNVNRYLHLLRRGEEHRKWLLSDMQFKDPVRSSHTERLTDFESKAMAFVGRQNGGTLSDEVDIDEGNDGWSTEEEDDTEERSLPSWYKNPQNR